MSKITRRNFLKQASLASAGIMIGGMGFSTKSYARIVGSNARVNVGVVGYSDRFRSSLLPCFLNHNEKLNFDITAVSDLWSMRREAAQENLTRRLGHAVALCRNNDELYADKNIDAVIISTADFQHALHAREAADEGRHIYCEKPFAETMLDNVEGRRAVERSGVVFQMGSQRRSGPNYHAANDFIRSGRFGDIVMCEMTWNVNQPGRWRRPREVEQVREQDIDWRRYLMNRPYEDYDPRKYLEYRLFWPYSSGIPGQWMAHQIDTVHWFSGLHYPRSVVANGGIYLWKDGRTNYDTMTAVFEYGPEDDPSKGFQVQYSSRFTNEAGGVKEIYYSNGGELNLDTNMVTSNGYLTAREARAMGMQENKLEEFKLEGFQVETGANTGGDPLTSAHMLNWMQCVRDGNVNTNAPVEAAYDHSVACIMVTAAMRTKQFVEFDKEHQAVIAGGKVFQY